jgi:hypothetical protein
MNNAVSILISNKTGIADADLYVFITDGNNNFYKVDAANSWTATPQTTACSVLLNALPTHVEGVYKFYISASTALNGGRVWFATSPTALSVNAKGGITQPTVQADFVFDFVEIATNPPVGTTVGNANIDVTQVDALGIPITLFVNPAIAMPAAETTINESTVFPPPIPTTPINYSYPNVLGIVPWTALNMLSDNFIKSIKNTPYAPFDVCAWSSGNIKRFVAPVHLIDDYASGTTPSALATFLDQAIYQFFSYYMTNTLTLQDPVSQNLFTGKVTTVTQTDTTGGQSTYNVLQFTGSGQTYNVYFPYFTTNCAAMPGVLNTGVALAPPPTWWTGNLPTAMPATAMALGCTGVFSDSAFQAGVTNTDLLGNLENQVVSLITRGVTPTNNNLVSFQAQFSAANITNNQATVTVTPFPTGLAAGMDVVKQIAAQPSNIVSVDSANNQFVLTSSVDALLPVNNCLFICGDFYPDAGTNTAGYSNIYSNFLHNGSGFCSAPLINNIGYGYAYDDQGGYSNDVTANYDTNNSLTIGIFLGPLKEEIA